jgi:TonB family protein
MLNCRNAVLPVSCVDNQHWAQCAREKAVMTKVHALPSLPLIAGLFLITGLTLLAGTVRAELRCDCTQIVDNCSAEVGFNDNRIRIKSSEDACSRVDYLIDGQPFAALVVNGETEFNWSGQPQDKPQIVVENCRVCADRKEGNFAVSEPEAEASDDAVDDTPQMLVKVMPDYPRSAWSQRLEGSVIVEFTVSEDGSVKNIKVVDSSSSVFVTSAIDAASRFRFTPGAAANVREQFNFRLLDGIDPTVSSATL